MNALAAHMTTNDTTSPRSRSFIALIVEDSPMIALDLETMLTGLGASVATVALSVSEAADILETFVPDIAFLDIGLGGGNSFALAQSLLESGVEVVFTTGTVEPREIPQLLASCPIVEKPYGKHHIEDAIDQALGSVC